MSQIPVYRCAAPYNHTGSGCKKKCAHPNERLLLKGAGEQASLRIVEASLRIVERSCQPQLTEDWLAGAKYWLLRGDICSFFTQAM